VNIRKNYAEQYTAITMKAGVCVGGIVCLVLERLYVNVCVCVRREDAAGKRVEERFLAAGENGKSHCIEEPKSSRNSNNAFPA